jgi:hypothetical protein
MRRHLADYSSYDSKAVIPLRVLTNWNSAQVSDKLGQRGKGMATSNQNALP